MQELRDDTKNGCKETGPFCEEDITSKIFSESWTTGGKEKSLKKHKATVTLITVGEKV